MTAGINLILYTYISQIYWAEYNIYVLNMFFLDNWIYVHHNLCYSRIVQFGIFI